MLELWYFTWVFNWQHLSMDTNVFDPVTLTLQLGPLFENFYLNSNFSTVSSRSLIFHNMFLVKWIFRGYQHILPTTLIFEFGLLWKFNHFNNFSIAIARVFLFHKNIPCDKLFLLVLNFLTLTFDLYFKMLTVVITCKKWIIMSLDVVCTAYWCPGEAEQI